MELHIDLKGGIWNHPECWSGYGLIWVVITQLSPYVETYRAWTGVL
jgi:hypothetical protein